MYKVDLGDTYRVCSHIMRREQGIDPCVVPNRMKELLIASSGTDPSSLSLLLHLGLVN